MNDGAEREEVEVTNGRASGRECLCHFGGIILRLNKPWERKATESGTYSCIYPPAMSRNDIDVFHIFQALPRSHFGEPVTVVEMAASTRRRGTLGRWPTTAGAAAMGIFAFLGIIHSAKGAILQICFLNLHFLRQGVKPVSHLPPFRPLL